MGIFVDAPKEDLGTRQRKWLDFLWYQNRKPFRVCKEFAPGKFTRWESIDECVCPVDHREILPFEIVIEFDTPFFNTNLVNIQTVLSLLADLPFFSNLSFFVTDHFGRSPHLHIFTKNEAWRKEIQEKVLHPALKRLDKMKLNSQGMIRCIGGRYYKKRFSDQDFFTYKSVVQDLDQIRPVKNPKEVLFPCNFRM